MKCRQGKKQKRLKPVMAELDCLGLVYHQGMVLTSMIFQIR